MASVAAKCKHCEGMRLIRLPVDVTQDAAFKRRYEKVWLCGICDSGDKPQEGALALALANHEKRLENS